METDQLTLWEDDRPACWLCETPLPRHSLTLCLSCRNTVVANAERVLDMRELLDYVRGWPGQPITMDRWAELIRQGKADTPDATRRSWERTKAWLRRYEAPVIAEPDEDGHGHKPLRFLAGFEAWLIRMEHEWLGWELGAEEDYALPIWGAQQRQGEEA